ncbi:uncharacterized protein B0H18DRAFT_976636 [Fomitopsis serialis]|uniref:uncharacterized protein n=1 Tax=Fomitopsis serialis TaxID=139415 RepID=UPI002007312A|nr:uncharacterized protein B0H18DRAFT_976636 [Neoantrodia serialis]KAH9935640.1 hypothetical protein B0H18DRAFT_976636 [Neoantrodia serialis]
MRHRECEIRITCDGQELDEYDVQVNGNVVECYVLSESGKVFEIMCSNTSSTQISTSTAVDGRVFPRRKALRAGRKDETLNYVVDVDNMKPLMFSDISITVTDDDNASKEPSSSANNLGLIQISVVRSTLHRTVPWTPLRNAEVQNFGAFHERTKKVGVHCVSLGARTSIPEPQTTLRQVVHIDDLSAPYIVFKFQYRPRALLQAQGIVQSIVAERPRNNSGASPDLPAVRDAPVQAQSPDGVSHRKRDDNGSGRPLKRPRQGGSSSSRVVGPLVSDTEDAKSFALKDEEDDSAEDLDALEAQIQAIRQRMDRAKRKRIPGGKPRVVKREPSPIQAGGVDGSVIDLTDD